MRTPVPLLITIMFSATAALAHSDVKNHHVQAWMGCMMALAESTEALSRMAQGQTPFSQKNADHAVAAIRHHAATIPDMFRTRADDPKSRARDAIWTDWDDFVDRSDRLITVTATAETGDPAQLLQTVDRIGSACKSCHAEYRD